jgi:small-conductance mechanosensitive channel
MNLDRVVFGNSLESWILSILITLILYFIFYALKLLVRRRLSVLAKEADTNWGKLAIKFINQLHPLFLLTLAIYVGSVNLSLPPTVEKLIKYSVGIFLLIQIGLSSSLVINFYINRYKEQKIESNAGAVTTATSAGFILRLMIWLVLILVALDNLGINIKTLIAGLGISGIAVALAVQSILGDLFASLSIVLDKPFVIGDFIIVNEYLGTVEKVGLKTTRIRSLSGEQLVISNGDLLKSRIRNFKRMYERRVLFSIGVLYQTPYEKLCLIPKMIREIIESKAPVRFDRAHFNEYGDYSLKFEIVYWIHSPDYNIYMDIQQAINLEIYKKFEESDISFAYPTQTLLLEQSNGRKSVDER